MQKNVATKCKCGKCGVEAVSIAGTRHRRCSGFLGTLPRSKRGMRLSGPQRGVWG